MSKNNFFMYIKRIKKKLIVYTDLKVVRRRVKKYFSYMKTIIYKKSHFAFIFFLLTVCAFLLIPLPVPLFEPDYSTVLKDREGKLLGAVISDDQQWRFPPVMEVPAKFKACILTFEDKNFYYHPGIDPFALFRALYLNMKHKRIVSGASTITMQVIRLSRKGQGRTIGEKIIEALLALKLELVYTKEQIMALYASNIPLGGNVVGIEAASWRYFARNPDNLSWAEAALLAVLPNDPAMIHPGRNRHLLLEKRNSLIIRLKEKGIISSTESDLAQMESLPVSPYPIPQKAPHLLSRTIKEGHKGTTVISSIDSNLQRLTVSIMEKHHKKLAASKIYNAAALIISTDTGEALAYAGNTKDSYSEEHGNYVDIITAERSPGSILKPFLYAFALDEGLILPSELLPDIPLMYRGFAPKNFSKTYDGAIPADKALARSLNIPFISLLQRYDYRKFYRRLVQLGMNLPYEPSHYSLTLILGGAESTLWDITGMYTSLARVLKQYPYHGYSDDDYFPNTYIKKKALTGTPYTYTRKKNNSGLLNAASVWFSFKAMREVIRPDDENNWKRYSSSKPIAWKTGTSYGNRDGWAIGITPDYVVGVWVGNADGEGRPEIRGVHVAGPLLFDIFDILPSSGWFQKPFGDLTLSRICKKSGMPASLHCEETALVEIPATGLRTNPCVFHRLVHLDENEEFQVDSSTYPVSKMVHKKYFVLPPLQEYFYKKKNSAYKILPPQRNTGSEEIQFVYPAKRNTIVYVPIELDGSRGKTVFEIIHRRPETRVFWHLDGEYIGETKTIHQMGLYPGTGKHEIVVIDEKGNTLVRSFEVLPGKRS